MQKVGNSNFGSQFKSDKINIKSFIAQCPTGCAKVGSAIFGVGLHPEETSICRAAIVDRAMPIFGGIIGLTIMHGATKYNKLDSPYMGIEVKEHAVS